MITPWYRLFDNPLEIDLLIALCKKTKPKNPKQINPTYGLNLYWWYIEDQDTYNKLNQIYPIQGKLCCWEWFETEGIVPHVDNNNMPDGATRAGSMNVPLIGNVLTCNYGPFKGEHTGVGATMISDTSKSVIDSLEYGPGQIMIIDNTRWIHSVNLISDYRLLIQTDIQKFI